MKKVLLMFLAIALYYMPTILIADENISKEEAYIVASNYLKLERLEFPVWENAKIKHIIPLYSSNNILVGYEATVVSDKDEPQGSILINANKKLDPVPSFSEEGESSYQFLLSYFVSELMLKINNEQLKPIEYQIIGAMPFFVSLGIKFEGNKKPENIDYVYQDGWYIFSPEPVALREVYHYNKELIAIGAYKALEVQSSWDTLLSTSGHIEPLRSIESHEISFNSIKQESQSENSDLKQKRIVIMRDIFSNFYQEKKRWNGSSQKCWTGCIPIAWVTLLEYWDRKGYSKLISSSKDNYNTSLNDPDIQTTLTELRSLLRTDCDGDGSFWNATRGEHYARSKGYSSSASNSSTSFDAWWRLKSNINKAYPIIAHLLREKHATVAFGYKDFSGTRGDKIKVRMGHEKDNVRWHKASNLYRTTSFKP